MFQLDAYGPKMYDGNPTVGTLKGVVIPAEGETVCGALFISGENECSVAITGGKSGVKLVQYGRCLTFGAGVESSGFYRKRSNL